MSAIERRLTQGAGLVNSYAAVRLAQNIRPDIQSASAGDSLLKSGVTLSGLDGDLKLVLKDQQNNFLEYAPLNSGFLLADGYVQASCLQYSDGLLAASGQAIEGAVSAGGFYSDGIIRATGYVHGGMIFSPGARAVWETALIGPLSSTSTNSIVLLSNADDAPMPGLSLIGSGSSYYPRRLW